MSTVTSFNTDPNGNRYAEGIAQSEFFSAFHNLMVHRKSEGCSKAEIADHMGIDRAAFTKLTSSPSNMKINTIATMANALNADIVFMLVDRSDRSRVFLSVGTYRFPTAFQGLNYSSMNAMSFMNVISPTATQRSGSQVFLSTPVSIGVY